MPRQAGVTSSTRHTSRRDNNNHHNDEYQDEDDSTTQGMWTLERPGFRHPQHQQQGRRSIIRNSRSSNVKTRDARAASVDSAFSVHRELYDESEDEEEQEQGQDYVGRNANVAPGMQNMAAAPALTTFGRAPPTTLPKSATAVQKKTTTTTATTTTIPQKRTRAYSDTDTRSRKQSTLPAGNHRHSHSHSRPRGDAQSRDRDRRKSDAGVGVQFKNPLIGLSGMNQDSQASIDVNPDEDDGMELDEDDSEDEKEKRAGHAPGGGGAGTDGGAASSQEYENIGLQDLARIERSAIHKPIVIEHTLSEQAEPLVNDLEDAYANQWQDILSDKDAELYATANALGEIVLVDSLKVADQVSNCGEAVLSINLKVSKALHEETHHGIERMSKLVAKQKALVEKLDENYARCKAREEKLFEDMQKIRDKTSATMEEANNIYVTSADNIEDKIKNLVNAKNLQAQFNSHLLKVTTGTARSTAAAGGGKKRGSTK